MKSAYFLADFNKLTALEPLNPSGSLHDEIVHYSILKKSNLCGGIFQPGLIAAQPVPHTRVVADDNLVQGDSQYFTENNNIVHGWHAVAPLPLINSLVRFQTYKPGELIYFDVPLHAQLSDAFTCCYGIELPHIDASFV